MDVEGILLTDSNIKTEEIKIKSEPIVEEMIFKIPCDIKKEPQEEGDSSLHHAQNSLIDAEESKSLHSLDDLKQISVEPSSWKYENKECIDGITSESRSTGHEIEINKSNGSSRKTKHQYSSRSQVKLIRKGLKVNEYKCDKCEYNTRGRNHFTRHQLLHKNPSEVEMYQCDACRFTTKHKGSLKKHHLIHKSPSEVQKYMCDKCKYKGKYKSNLQRHRLIHQRSSPEVRSTSATVEFKTNLQHNFKQLVKFSK